MVEPFAIFDGMRVLLACLTAFLAIYCAFVLFLIFTGKKTSARAVAGFIPDCIVLFKNLMQDRMMPSRYKIILAILMAYLALPIDLVPDFIPIAGQLDDAIVVALVLRLIIKGAGKDIVKKNWQGPEASLRITFKITRIGYS